MTLECIHAFTSSVQQGMGEHKHIVLLKEKQ